MVHTDQDDCSGPSAARSERQLRAIADQLGLPIASFYGVQLDEDVELLELVRLWHVIADPVGRQRVLNVARQEARWNGHMDDG